MKKLNSFYVLTILLLMCSYSYAQKWDAKQTEVWDVVLSSWEDINNGKADWSDKWVMKNAMVWGTSFPMPRDQKSVKRWDTYSFPQSKTLESEFAPTAIVVHGSTAVAHYYYSIGAKNKDGKHKTTHGRCTDIFTKDGKEWKFLAWNCSDTPDKDYL